MNVFRGKKKNFLTVLAITIGVASVLLVSSIGENGEKVVNEELEKLGLKGVSVFQNQSHNAIPLYAEDAKVLENRFEYIKKTLPIVMEIGSLKFNRITSDAVLLGVGQGAEDVYNVNIIHGRTPNTADVRLKKRVAVIDDELAMKAYKRKNVVGKKITVKHNEKSEVFDIIGVIKSQKDGINQLFGNSIPNFVYLPYSTLNEIRNKKELSQIAISCTAEYNSDGSEFSNFLSKVKSAPRAYSSKNLSTKISEIKSVSGMVSGIMSAVAAIALLVAGIGIMNAMLSSALERKREIGILMAIGAKKRNILLCFLCESVLIVFFGSVFGAITGFSCLKLLSYLTRFEITFSLKTLLKTEIVSFACGIFFSIIPAMKASKISPIKALGRE